MSFIEDEISPGPPNFEFEISTQETLLSGPDFSNTPNHSFSSSMFESDEDHEDVSSLSPAQVSPSISINVPTLSHTSYGIELQRSSLSGWTLQDSLRHSRPNNSKSSGYSSQSMSSASFPTTSSGSSEDYDNSELTRLIETEQLLRLYLVVFVLGFVILLCLYFYFH